MCDGNLHFLKKELPNQISLNSENLLLRDSDKPYGTPLKTSRQSKYCVGFYHILVILRRKYVLIFLYVQNGSYCNLMRKKWHVPKINTDNEDLLTCIQPDLRCLVLIIEYLIYWVFFCQLQWVLILCWTHFNAAAANFRCLYGLSKEER